MPTKTKKKFAHFTVRRIANRNPRHARAFQRAHRRLWQLTFGFLTVLIAIGGLLATTGHLSGDYLQSSFSLSGSGISIGGSTVGGSISIGGGSAGPVFGGPGAKVGLTEFAVSYGGNQHSSAIGMIVGWTNFALPFVSVLAIAALIYAGFLYITALGNDEQTQKAKKIILWVVIGIILIFSAYAIVNTITSGQAG
jgi:type IV secretory pathway VirB2 component (pilin)